jgi:dTDP-4-dehydrorhamnose reductase
MRVLITGAAGQVGRELVAAFADHQITFSDSSALDVTSRSAVLAAVTATRPDAILHAAAWTAVDACEGDPDRAFAVNSLGTRHVAEAARRVGAHLTYFSTDYIFDGAKADPYVEWDSPNPQSVYGRSKLAGEREAAACPDSLIVRISWVCGFHGTNMVKTVLRLAAERRELAFVDDQHGHPTFAADLAPLVYRLVAERRPGVFHITNQGETTWFEFARAVLEASGADPGRVRPIATADLDPPRAAPRPPNSTLDNMALRLEGLPLLPHYRESLDRLVRQLGAR